MLLIDRIEIEKLWFDDELAQLSVVCSSSVITASTKIYVNDALVDELIYQTERFLSGKAKESEWANEERGDHTPPCVSFRFCSHDMLGHILVEVYMELDDGGEYNSHNCCFYIQTEIGQLERFCKSLPHLKRKEPNIRVVLND